MTGARDALPCAGVIGWPVAHSLSPAMMTAWLDASGAPGTYAAFSVAPDDCEAALSSLPKLGMTGVNVTAPHKTRALEIADTVSDTAQRLGAANLIGVRADGRLHAHNTDLDGIRAAIAAMNGARLRAPAVLIGAGGAARAALSALAETEASTLRIVNRTPSNAEDLADALGVKAEIFGLESLTRALDGAGVVINASSVETRDIPDLERLDPAGGVVEMTYAPLHTPWIQAAHAANRRSVDGLVMLIGQARPSFATLFGAPPPGDDALDMHAYLRSAQQGREAP